MDFIDTWIDLMSQSLPQGAYCQWSYALGEKKGCRRESHRIQLKMQANF